LVPVLAHKGERHKVFFGQLYGFMSDQYSHVLSPLKASEVTSRSNRNGKIRSAEFPHHSEVNSYDFALVIEERAAGAARGGLGIIDNLVIQDVADVPLGGDGSDQLTAREFFHHLL